MEKKEFLKKKEEYQQQISDINLKIHYLKSEYINTSPMKQFKIGDNYFYNMLYAYEEDFRNLFKIMADFDIEIDKNDEVEQIIEYTKTIYRLTITHKNLLEWTTSEEAEKNNKNDLNKKKQLSSKKKRKNTKQKR